MTPRPLSRKKLTDYLRSSQTHPVVADSEIREAWTRARNCFADVLIMSIAMGDFDEDNT